MLSGGERLHDPLRMVSGRSGFRGGRGDRGDRSRVEAIAGELQNLGEMQGAPTC